MKNKLNPTWTLVVIKLKNIGTNNNPLAYYSISNVDLIEAVEEFFEGASIEVHYTEVERIAKDLADNGFSYWNEEFLFNII